MIEIFLARSLTVAKSFHHQERNSTGGFSAPDLNEGRQGWVPDKRVSDPTNLDYVDIAENKYLNAILQFPSAEQVSAFEGLSKKQREELIEMMRAQIEKKQ